MIPKIIHYCWFGRGEMPDEAKKCIASWHKYMPDYEYKMWNEDNFDVNAIPYTSEAYSAKKYAFVSDYVRLWALAKEGGIYFDTDVEVFKSFDDLLEYKAFAGLQGSKGYPVGTFVMASQAHGEWVEEQLSFYHDRHFEKSDGSFDMTTNVEYMTRTMAENGFLQNGTEQDYKDLHIFPVDYFCPKQTTGEYFFTENTYSDHLGMGSWADGSDKWKSIVGMVIGPKNMIRLIKLKRKILK